MDRKQSFEYVNFFSVDFTFIQDSTNRFHGFNHIILTPEADPNLVAPDPTLGWRVKSIKGYFVHGYLEGPSYVELQVS